MQTEFNAFVWWDLRNGTNTTGSFDPTLYGWRTYGDLGMISGLTTRHPTFYTAKLMQHFARPGDTVLSASSDYLLLAPYAARRASGAVTLLVINKDATASFAAQITLAGYTAISDATVRSYGIPQDEAARTGIGSPDIALTTFAGAGALFSYPFPPYSATLFTLAPAAPRLLAAVQPPPPPGQFVFRLQGQPGVRYVVQTSTNLAAWSPAGTNVLTGSVLNVTNPIPAGVGRRFWRALWQP